MNLNLASSASRGIHLLRVLLVVVSLQWLGQESTTGAEPLPRVALTDAYPQLEFDRPAGLATPPDGSRRLFVVEQRGRILRLPSDPAGREAKVFLDLTDRHPFGENEEGLLGLAFHPQFKRNGAFYVYYSQQHPRRTVLSEFRTTPAAPEHVGLATERVLLQVAQPDWNHKGGALAFGPDGYLYVSLGDGGSANDPHNFAQNLETLLGKILRLDVDARTGKLAYGIPRDNPFAAGARGARPEIWASGLRNVWRLSFDRETGALWAADVGQDKWEEIDLIVKGGNYGWSWREGLHPFKEPVPAGVRLLDPILEYPHPSEAAANLSHSPGTSITGGYVYRGRAMPRLRGVYLYGDYTLGTIWGLEYRDGRIVRQGTLLNQPKNLASFGEDADGELYALLFDGKICRLTEAP